MGSSCTKEIAFELRDSVFGSEKEKDNELTVTGLFSNQNNKANIDETVDGLNRKAGSFHSKMDPDDFFQHTGMNRYTNAAIIAICSYVDEFDIESDIQFSEQEPVLMSEGSTYQGSLNLNKQRHGFGELVSSAGGGYKGDWMMNMRHGKGRLVNSNGAIYVGDFIAGVPQGMGIYRYMGYQYSGEVCDSIPHGFGREEFNDNSFYEGYFVNGQYQGQGRFYFAGGLVYTGDFNRGNAHGKGRIEYSNKTIYEGDIENNKRHGIGKLVVPNQLIYTGSFYNDKFSGVGVLSW